ncbi:hypothetical protein BT63DRAFT_426863 [Microthyrium microscopicum]|uniref:DUF7730 domain-containing protein n=1 Tax=Microthyrium microscopicum TaxID=703497 RepID=A0A6A6U773_9PEZI|nr:hypothetical protein BT63DRAFT_426863 [Microthyrium microscopicum]
MEPISKIFRAFPRKIRGSSDSWFHYESNTDWTQYSQLDSLIFSLPTEIRARIYEYAFSGKRIHILRLVDDKHQGIECPYDECRCIWDKQELLYPGSGLPAAHKPSNTRSPLGFILSCRRAYDEAITTIYKENTFLLQHIQTLPLFTKPLHKTSLVNLHSLHVSWKCSILTHYYIRYARNVPTALLNLEPPFDITSWNKFCKQLQRLQGLRVMLLSLTTNWDNWVNHPAKQEAMATWLRPLRDVTQATERFDVWLFRCGKLKENNH